MQLEETIAKEIADIIKEQFVKYDEHIRTIEAKLTAANVKIAALETRKPEKGERGERGEKGDRGDVGLRGETGIPGRDGKDGIAGPIGAKGDKGDPGLDGKDGRDGIDGKDGAGPSRGRHRGAWKHGEEYHLDDSVMDHGGVWIAMVENPKGRPTDSKDGNPWQLVLRKARDGKDGERGPPGPQGLPGKDLRYA